MRLAEMIYTEEDMNELREENKKLKEYNRRLKQGNDDLKEQNKKLSEKNGQLKSDLAFKNTMLDNVKAEYESSQKVIKKLKEERIFSLWEWDYIILTSTTPQLKLTKREDSDLYSNITYELHK